MTDSDPTAFLAGIHFLSPLHLPAPLTSVLAADPGQGGICAGFPPWGSIMGCPIPTNIGMETVYFCSG